MQGSLHTNPVSVSSKFKIIFTFKLHGSQTSHPEAPLVLDLSAHVEVDTRHQEAVPDHMSHVTHHPMSPLLTLFCSDPGSGCHQEPPRSWSRKSGQSPCALAFRLRKKTLLKKSVGAWMLSANNKDLTHLGNDSVPTLLMAQVK